MKSLFKIRALALLAALFTGNASAQEKKEATAKAVTLKVGDPAPKLAVSEFVQGDEVKEFEKDKVYIVEFWATWCGPCRATIPHINELHQKLESKGLVVIGQNCWENDESKVQGFIETMGDKMTYRVAMDDKSKDKKGAMATTWMAAAGQNGIPSAFVVAKDGTIAWIGHPAGLTEEMLTEVIAGTFDSKKFAEAREKEEAEMNKLREAITPLMPRLQKAMTSSDWDEATAVADELEKVLPESRRTMVAQLRMDIAIGKKDGAAATAQAVILAADKDIPAMGYNALAWKLVTAKGLEGIDLEKIEKIARTGVEKSKGGEAESMVLDTLARVVFMRGNKDEAIKIQEDAISKAGEGNKEGMEATLESYNKGELPEVNEEQQ